MKERKIYLLIFLVCSFSSFLIQDLHGQTADFGCANLIIKLSGRVEERGTDNLGTPHYSNLFESEKPEKFNAIDDSTVCLSTFIFGPTYFSFFYKNRYIVIVLNPNITTTLHIHHFDFNDYKIEFDGDFREVFDNSKNYEEFIKKALFEYRPTLDKRAIEIKKPYKNANEFRDNRILDFKDRISFAADSTKSLPVFLKSKMINNLKTSLIVDYENSVLKHNRKIGLDSLSLYFFVPQRDLSYYDKILDTTYSDVDVLLCYDAKLLHAVRNDTLLDLPDIMYNSPATYINKVRKMLPSQRDIFYNIMLTGVYIDQISNGKPLSNNQKNEISTYFDNTNFSNYILYLNEINVLKNKIDNTGKFHFPFLKEKKNVFVDIVAKYKGKAVFIDFWATWCGPCIAAFDEMREVKARYANRNDLVFVYLTDESSDYGKWIDYVNLLGGEHYFLYKNQMSNIYKQYNIEYLPSYLIFDKEGLLIDKSIGKYVGNEKVTEWIEKALRASSHLE